MGADLVIVALLGALGAEEVDCAGETELRNTRSVAITASIGAGDLRRYDADIAFVWIENSALHVRTTNEGPVKYVLLEGEKWLISQTYDHFCKNQGGPESVPIRLAGIEVSASHCPELPGAIENAIKQLNSAYDVLDVLQSGGTPDREPVGIIQVDGPAYQVHIRTGEGNASMVPRDSVLYTAVGDIFNVLKECRPSLSPCQVIVNDF